MKKYRILVALALVALMAYSIYSLVSSSIEKAQTEEDLLAQAKVFEEEKLYAKASEIYAQLAELEGGSKYYVEAARMYADAEQWNSGRNWAQSALEIFPKDPDVYVVLLDIYIGSDNYEEAYKLLRDFDGRKLKSDEVEQIRSDIKYAYRTEKFYYEDIREWSGGYATILKVKTFGALNDRANESLSANYSYAGYFVNGLMPVCNTNDEWFFINDKGESEHNVSLGVKGEIDDVGCMNDDVFPCCANGKYAYYHLDFSPLLADSKKFDYAGAFFHGVAAVRNGSSWELINTNGDRIGGDTYQDIAMDERGFCNLYDRVFVKKGGKYVMLNSSGDRVGNMQFDEVKAFAGDAYAAVKQGGEWGYIDVDGNYLLEPKYDDACPFSEGLAAVKVGSAWKFIDRSGTECIDLDFDNFIECRRLSENGMVFCKSDNGWWMIEIYSYKYK